MELQSGFSLKNLRSDKGSEYTSHEFLDCYSNIGMVRQLMVAYIPHKMELLREEIGTMKKWQG